MKATYPTSLSLSEKERDEIIFCKRNKYSLKDVFVLGLNEALKQIEQGAGHDTEERSN